MSDITSSHEDDNSEDDSDDRSDYKEPNEDRTGSKSPASYEEPEDVEECFDQERERIRWLVQSLLDRFPTEDMISDIDVTWIAHDWERSAYHDLYKPNKDMTKYLHGIDDICDGLEDDGDSWTVQYDDKGHTGRDSFCESIEFFINEQAADRLEDLLNDYQHDEQLNEKDWVRWEQRKDIRNALNQLFQKHSSPGSELSRIKVTEVAAYYEMEAWDDPDSSWKVYCECAHELTDMLNEWDTVWDSDGDQHGFTLFNAWLDNLGPNFIYEPLSADDEELLDFAGGNAIDDSESNTANTHGFEPNEFSTDEPSNPTPDTGGLSDGINGTVDPMLESPTSPPLSEQGYDTSSEAMGDNVEITPEDGDLMGIGDYEVEDAGKVSPTATSEPTLDVTSEDVDMGDIISKYSSDPAQDAEFPEEHHVFRFDISGMPFGQFEKTKLATCNPAFEFDFGANTADLSQLKRELDVPQGFPPTSSFDPQAIEEHLVEQSAVALEPMNLDVGATVQDEIAEDDSLAMSSSDTASQDSLSSPGSSVAEVIAVGAVDRTQSWHVPRELVATAQVEMIMNDHSEKHRDLVAKIEAMNAKITSLQQSSSQGHYHDLKKIASELEAQVADFGQLSEQDAVKKLVETSRMATEPEEQDQSEPPAIEAAEQVHIDEQPEVVEAQDNAGGAIQASNDAPSQEIKTVETFQNEDTVQQQPDPAPASQQLVFQDTKAISTDELVKMEESIAATEEPAEVEDTISFANNVPSEVDEMKELVKVENISAPAIITPGKVEETRVATQEVAKSPSKSSSDTLFDANNLAGANGEIAQWGARNEQKRRKDKAEEKVLKLHKENPDKRPTTLYKVAKLSTRIARLQNEWDALVPQNLPGPLSESGKGLIEVYRNLDKTDRSRALKKLRELIQQWAALRKLVKVFLRIKSDCDQTTDAAVDRRDQYRAFVHAAPGSAEKDELRNGLRKALNKSIEHYRWFFHASQELAELAPNLFIMSTLGRALEDTLAEYRYRLQVAHQAVDLTLPELSIDIYDGAEL